MAIGFILAAGALLDSWLVFHDLFRALSGGGGGFFEVLIGYLYLTLLAKPLLYLARRVRPGVLWALGILVVAYSLLNQDPNPIIAAWLLVVGVLAMGTPPLLLTVGVGCGMAIALFLFEMPFGIFAIPIVAIGFLRYPTGISFRRFLFPARGVM
jgi:hypothetical protein